LNSPPSSSLAETASSSAFENLVKKEAKDLIAPSTNQATSSTAERTPRTSGRIKKERYWKEEIESCESDGELTCPNKEPIRLVNRDNEDYSESPLKGKGKRTPQKAGGSNKRSQPEKTMKKPISITPSQSVATKKALKKSADLQMAPKVGVFSVTPKTNYKITRANFFPGEVEDVSSLIPTNENAGRLNENEGIIQIGIDASVAHGLLQGGSSHYKDGNRMDDNIVESVEHEVPDHGMSWDASNNHEEMATREEVYAAVVKLTNLLGEHNSTVTAEDETLRATQGTHASMEYLIRIQKRRARREEDMRSLKNWIERQQRSWENPAVNTPYLNVFGAVDPDILPLPQDGGSMSEFRGNFDESLDTHSHGNGFGSNSAFRWGGPSSFTLEGFSPFALEGSSSTVLGGLSHLGRDGSSIGLEGLSHLGQEGSSSLGSEGLSSFGRMGQSSGTSFESGVSLYTAGQSRTNSFSSEKNSSVPIASSSGYTQPAMSYHTSFTQPAITPDNDHEVPYGGTGIELNSGEKSIFDKHSDLAHQNLVPVDDEGPFGRGLFGDFMESSKI
jgi:hypothetical protein